MKPDLPLPPIGARDGHRQADQDDEDPQLALPRVEMVEGLLITTALTLLVANFVDLTRCSYVGAFPE